MKRKGHLTSNTANAVNNIVDHLLANGVVATSIVVGSVLLTADQLLRVEELAVGTGSDLINWRWVEVNEERTGNMLATARLGEEGFEGAWVANILGVGVGATIKAKTVLQEIADLQINKISRDAPVPTRPGRRGKRR